MFIAKCQMRMRVVAVSNGTAAAKSMPAANQRWHPINNSGQSPVANRRTVRRLPLTAARRATPRRPDKAARS